MGSESPFAAQKRTSSALPTTTTASNGGSRVRAAALLPRGRQINKTFNNIKITIICGFVTILVLRGTIGIGNLVSYEAEAENQNLHEEINRILAEIRSDKDPDDPEDQAEEFFNPNRTFTLGPKISNWDGDRKVWLEKNPMFPSYVNGKPRLLLVTGSPPNPCDNAIGDHYLLKAAKNKIDYCRIHGIEIVYNMAHLDKELAGYWAKLPLIRGLMLAHPEVEWVWWMDSDALFTDMAFEIPVFKYKDHNMVIHGYPDLLFDQKSWIALNTGSFLFRNCQWSLDLLDAWAPMGPKGPVRQEAGKILTANLKGRPAFEADDQSALIYLLISQNDKWMNKVFVENSFYLHGYWEGLVDRYEEMMEKYHPGLGDDRWPFVTHFVGCKPCGSYGDYPVERCLKSMERAFNFADNQVLNLYGFRHRGLISLIFDIQFIKRMNIGVSICTTAFSKVVSFTVCGFVNPLTVKGFLGNSSRCTVLRMPRTRKESCSFNVSYLFRIPKLFLIRNAVNSHYPKLVQKDIVLLGECRMISFSYIYCLLFMICISNSSSFD